MKNLLKSLFCLVVLTAGLATQAQAQLATYQFTGTLIAGRGSAGFGSTITGSLTLDVGATPYEFVDTTPYVGCGEYGRWSNGGFSIDGITNTGFTAGTSFGGSTEFFVQDIPCYPYNVTAIRNDSDDGIHSRSIYITSYSYAVPGDGIANVPNPWQPFADQYQVVYIGDYNYSTGVYEYGYFTLDTFTAPPSTTIIIDGFDTGIPDFVYNGKLVSQHLADCAAGAKNHGDYVSCVAKLTNALEKAGLLTIAQKGVITSCAVQSNIGK